MVVTGEMTALETAYRTVYVGVLIFLALMIFFCLIRAVKGPRVADRIVAVNMIGTMVMVIIAILALLLNEGYLVDICLIYAMISFLAVIVLTKVYMGVHSENQVERKEFSAIHFKRNNYLEYMKSSKIPNTKRKYQKIFMKAFNLIRVITIPSLHLIYTIKP